ncbi:uncharacterized protein ColSpa_06213 [Colletotrichum spaethianum]|uniref:Uncharacterized protein n=1 Tax=Colletotrichum spaethianum TaxID=700344 RepID=A0AA37LKL0_9PEZI|nr:uncharacterized protein ColSpa_06213 [Colletotrichum spaethianum]GKT46032.1 hypothetical protein ColSpa_06213 [Colletotrichum spaethianum]
MESHIQACPAQSQISVLDVGSTGSQFNDLIWVDPNLKMEQPQFAYSHPCHVKIPPWTGANGTSWPAVIFIAPDG